ncbi:hypothetical protein EMPS_09860 [Entomortierella parvispora]|uniref:Uncharacterized protein n=1 Tax=Entomortierella parvispora TaxID=205924 RepID=A0A9P3M0F3_9FUNG|nr:hypothetical protein EMPS_09860 [Entomortierella parvispora]
MRGLSLDSVVPSGNSQPHNRANKNKNKNQNYRSGKNKPVDSDHRSAENGQPRSSNSSPGDSNRPRNNHQSSGLHRPGNNQRGNYSQQGNSSQRGRYSQRGNSCQPTNYHPPGPPANTARLGVRNGHDTSQSGGKSPSNTRWNPNGSPACFGTTTSNAPCNRDGNYAIQDLGRYDKYHCHPSEMPRNQEGKRDAM